MNFQHAGGILLSCLLWVITLLPAGTCQSITETVNVGDTAYLECVFQLATNLQNIQIYWLKDGEVIVEINDAYSLVEEPYRGRFKRQGSTNNLQINEVMLVDAGIYNCNSTTEGVVTSTSNVQLVVKDNSKSSSTSLVVVLLIVAFFIVVALTFTFVYISRKRKRNKDSVTDGLSSEGLEDKGLNKKFMWNDVSLDANNQPPITEACPPSPGDNSSVTSYPCSTAFTERSVSDIWSFFSGDDRGSLAYPPSTPLNATIQRDSLAYPSPTQLSNTFDWGFMGHPAAGKKKFNSDRNETITKNVNKSTTDVPLN